MKVPNLLCCASLAFVNERADITITTRSNVNGGGKRCYPFTSLSLLNDDLHNTCHGTDSSGSKILHGHSQRRTFVQTMSKSLLGPMLLLTKAESARAACLSGDIRAECIGIYKLPIDALESPYIDTPEKLKVYAPDLQWVPPQPIPSTYANALDQLREQRRQLDAAQELIANGDMEKAGLVLLGIIPKVTVAGSVILKAFSGESNKERNLAMKRRNKKDKDENGGIDNDGNPSSTPKATALEMKAYRIEYALNELLGYLGETDVLIGQGLRGDLGVSAPAQIEILSNFPFCRKEFDNLIGAVPEKLSIL